jgi:hypothetical protein
MKRMKMVVAIALVAVGALAAWLVTTQLSINNNVFNTGSAQASIMSGSPTSTIWPAVLSAGPGTIAQGELDLNNDGSAAADNLRFAGELTNTDALLAAGVNLRIGSCGVATIGSTPSGCPCDFPYHNADGTTRALTNDTEVYAGTLAGAAGKLFGDKTTGQQTGDRLLDFNKKEHFCYSVVLPLSAPTSLAGKSNTTVVNIFHERQS